MRSKNIIFLIALLWWMSGCSSLHLDRRQIQVPVWVTEGETTVRDNAIAATLAPPLEEVWSFNAGAGFGRVSPLIVDEVGLVATRKGEVHAVHLNTGRRLGQTSFGEAIEGTPVIENGILYVPVAWGGSAVQAHDLARGSTLWKAGRIPVAAGLVADETAVFAANVEGYVTAYDLKAGEELWQASLGERVGVKASPLLLDGLLIVGDDVGRVTAFNAGDGSVAWTADVGAPIHASPAADGLTVFVPTTRGRLVALNASDGAHIWEVRAPSKDVYMAPVAVGETDVVFGGSDGVVRSVHIEDGSLRWSSPTGAAITAAPLIAGSTIYVGTMRSRLIGLDAAEGEIVWKTKLGGRIKSNFAANGAQLLVLTEPRRVHLFRMSEESYALRDN